MNEENVRLLLKSLKIDYKRETHNGPWLNIACPFAPFLHDSGTDNTPSFGILIDDKKRSAFKCWSCNQKGSLAKLAARLAHYRKKNYSEQIHWVEMTELQGRIAAPLGDYDQLYVEEISSISKEDLIPDQSTLEAYPLAEAPAPLRYLMERGLTWIDIARLNIRYDDYSHRVLFPVYDTQQRLRGMSGRLIDDRLIVKGKNPKIRDYAGLPKKSLLLSHWNINATLGNVQGVEGRQVLVEGLLDLGNMYSLGFQNTRATMGTAFTQEKADILISVGLPVYLLFDDDKAGQDAMLGSVDNTTGDVDLENSWAYNLYRHIPVWICRYPESAEGKDPGKLTLEEAYKAVKSAELYTEKFQRI